MPFFNTCAPQQKITRLGLHYRSGDYAGTLRLVPRTPEVACDTITNVRVTDRALEETILLDFSIQNAGIREFSFLLPAEMADCRIKVPMLRQKTIEKAGKEPDSPIRVKIELQDEVKLLKAAKDGRLVMEIERKKGDADLKEEPAGWLAKKTKWVRVFETTISDEKDDDLGLTEHDHLIRAIKTPARQFVGWVIYEGGEWVGHPGANTKMLLQNRGIAKDTAERIMGNEGGLHLSGS